MNVLNFVKIGVTVALLAALAGCKTKGEDFVGVWKNSGEKAKTVTITKVDGSYRAVEDGGLFFGLKIDNIMVPESDKVLTVKGGSTPGYVLSEDGKTLTSNMRSKPDATFSKVN